MTIEEARTQSSAEKRKSGTLSEKLFFSLLLLVSLSLVLLVSTACSLGGANSTPPSTRAATQTPWIIYVPVTNTPEPVTVTPLPSVTMARQVTATRTSAPKAAATKPPVIAPTKLPATPVVALPTSAPSPSCSAGAVTLQFPESGALRRTKLSGPGSDTFKFKWMPFQQYESDRQTGYRIDIESKYVGTGKRVNGDVVYISHNGFLKERPSGPAGEYTYDARRVHGLAGGGDSDLTVYWKVTVIKTNGSFDDLGGMTGSAVNCSPPSQTWTILLQVLE